MMIMMLLALAAQAPTPTPGPTPTPPPLARLHVRATPPAGGGSSLADVARGITLRKQVGGESQPITNERMLEIAAGAELTMGAPERASSGFAVGETGDVQDSQREVWQQRYREALGRIQALEAQIRRLQSEVGRLERSFYAEDDPHYRDGVIKPAWDTALAELRSSRVALEEARNAPQEIMNQARREGALPGWFRGLDPAAPPPPTPRGPDRAREP